MWDGSWEMTQQKQNGGHRGLSRSKEKRLWELFVNCHVPFWPTWYKINLKYDLIDPKSYLLESGVLLYKETDIH